MIFLIVDDNANARKLIREIIEQDGDIIYECNDGQQSIEIYKLVKPDWVLMDIKMEKMDGISATKTIKKNYPDANIAIVTGYNDNYLKKEAEKAGANVFITKDNLLTLNLVIKKNN